MDPNEGCNSKAPEPAHHAINLETIAQLNLEYVVTQARRKDTPAVSLDDNTSGRNTYVLYVINI